MTTTTESFHLPSSACEAYEARFVPRLFAPWATRLVRAVAMSPGQRILDVACGTGIVARTVAERFPGRMRVTGVDLNPNMLAVARAIAPAIEWREGDAGALPFDDASFDVVLCQSAMMFFPDVDRALREMARVVARDGIVAVQVWGSLGIQPAYSILVAIAARHAGPDALRLLSTYWSLGDVEAFQARMHAAGFAVATVESHTELAPFESLDELVETEVRSTPLGERLDAGTYERILSEARRELARFEDATGRYAIPLVGHLMVASRASLPAA
jgi:ubiquinone/menaquinone biosynthesis C-methylase UbiE